jgi:hypothetical protein
VLLVDHGMGLDLLALGRSVETKSWAQTMLTSKGTFALGALVCSARLRSSTQGDPLLHHSARRSKKNATDLVAETLQWRFCQLDCNQPWRIARTESADLSVGAFYLSRRPRQALP